MFKHSFFVISLLFAGCFSPDGTVSTDSETSVLPTTNSTKISISGDAMTTEVTSTTEIVPHTTTDTFGTTENTITTSTTTGNTTVETSFSTSTAPTSGQNPDLPFPAICGDGILQAGEECDDRLPPDPTYKAECHNCIYDRKIFISTPPFFPAPAYVNKSLLLQILYGNCKNNAESGGINTFGFRPIISWQGYNWYDKLNDSGGRYVLPNGDIFANSYNDIMNNIIITAPIYTATGEVFGGYVWTGINSSDPTDHCNNWTNSTSSDYGIRGYTLEKDESWIFHGKSQCSEAMLTYCIQDKFWNDEVFP